MLLSMYNLMSSPPSYHTKVLCKYRVIIGVAVIFFVLFFFNQTYLKSQYFDSNIFTIKYQERLLQPKEAATNLSHLMFVLVGSSRTWRDRKVYLGSWWRPNVTKKKNCVGVAVVFFVLVLFNQTYINSQSFDSNIFTIKYQERLLQPKETATNLSHLMFVLVGGSRTWRDRKVYVESWWRPNVTRGNIFFDVEPSEEFQPWSRDLPPLKVNEDLKKLKIYPKLRNRIHTRIYRSILENYRLKQDQDVRWYDIY
ncbi:hypothetical protein F2Q68_00022864 [Brassica cretica]|uniref:Uncharacterized protein n=1 Tax=Brassica cretica TaxID=69181 RepID=A0A8S9FT35_BRACR|nr:hypothetical protein F2Q68_00022864 [Brassica cretica]